MLELYSSFVFQHRAANSRNFVNLPWYNTRTFLRALIVDDDNFNVKIMPTFISKCDFSNLFTAKDGREALNLYIQEFQNRISLIVIDFDIPVMNGKDAVIKIRDFEREKNLKKSMIIMVSGHCSNELIEECLEKNGSVQADYFLKKPVKFDQISELLKGKFIS